jgi:hypothetical protein
MSGAASAGAIAGEAPPSPSSTVRHISQRRMRSL